MKNRLRVDSAWTDHRVELLKTLWAGNAHSCAAIAAELGGGLSRNAVIGKALRMGLPPKGHVHSTPRNKPQRPRVARVVIQRNGRGYISTADDQPIAELEAPRPSTFLGIALSDLEREHCRYPRDIDGLHLQIAGWKY